MFEQLWGCATRWGCHANLRGYGLCVDRDRPCTGAGLKVLVILSYLYNQHPTDEADEQTGEARKLLSYDAI
jgi:hypothetical protein